MTEWSTAYISRWHATCTAAFLSRCTSGFTTAHSIGRDTARTTRYGISRIGAGIRRGAPRVRCVNLPVTIIVYAVRATLRHAWLDIAVAVIAVNGTAGAATGLDIIAVTVTIGTDWGTAI